MHFTPVDLLLAANLLFVGIGIVDSGRHGLMVTQDFRN